jgi:hypothetical protein
LGGLRSEPSELQGAILRQIWPVRTETFRGWCPSIMSVLPA